MSALRNALTSAERAQIDRAHNGPVTRQAMLDKLAARGDGSLARFVREEDLANARAMVAFHDQRIADFTKSLAEIRTWQPGGLRDAWEMRTLATIADHQRDRAAQVAIIAELEGETLPLAAE